MWQLNKLDALILATMAAMRSTEQKLGIVSAFDYGLILFPLLKSFLQVWIGLSGSSLEFSYLLVGLHVYLYMFSVNLSL